MMKKDRVIKFGIAVVLVSAMVVGGSIAYFRAETASKNTMSSTNLKIALLENLSHCPIFLLVANLNLFVERSPCRKCCSWNNNSKRAIC